MLSLKSTQPIIILTNVQNLNEMFKMNRIEYLFNFRQPNHPNT